MNRKRIVIWFGVLVYFTASQLSPRLMVQAKSSKKPKPKAQSQVHVSPEDGLASVIFRTARGAEIIAHLPMNTLTSDAEIGGTVERQLPPLVPGETEPDTNEISGTVTVAPHKKQSNFSPLSVISSATEFTCPPSDDGQYDLVYTPPKGPVCTATVACPPPVAPPSTPLDASTCGIPQLASSNGSLHCTMAGGSEPAKNACLIGGQPAACQAWSGEGAVFHVPPASKLAPGASSVIVRRGKKLSVGQTHIAKIKMTAEPSHLKSGQPCTVTTTVYCPGLENVQNGKLVISNYNPAVLNMPSHVVPIPSKLTGQSPSTKDLLKRDGLTAVQNLKEQLSKSSDPTSPENQKLMDSLNSMQELLKR